MPFWRDATDRAKCRMQCVSKMPFVARFGSGFPTFFRAGVLRRARRPAAQAEYEPPPSSERRIPDSAKMKGKQGISLYYYLPSAGMSKCEVLRLGMI